jgi:hypothetical protein
MSDEAGSPVPSDPRMKRRALRRVRLRGLLIGILAGLVCLLAAFSEPVQLLRSYLLAFLYWVSLSLGCLAIVMLSHLSPGGWSVMLRRPLEAGGRTVLTMAVLFVPILAGVRLLYPWAASDEGEAGDPGGHADLGAKEAYLNVPFFTVRAIVFLALWAAAAHFLSRMSRAQDATRDPEAARRLRKASAVWLVVYAVTMTFASIDWMMSLQPHWWSTIYGVYVIGGQGLSAMAFGTVAALWIARSSRPRFPLQTRHLHDFGKMLLAFVMLWTYFALSQLIIVWSGNQPEDIPFYLDRRGGGFLWVSVALAVLHFALPFLLLLSRDVKRDARTLAFVAGLVLVMRWVDFYWLVAPAWSHGKVSFHWQDPVAFLAVGGAWAATFAWQLGCRPLLPLGDPVLPEAIREEEEVMEHG